MPCSRAGAWRKWARSSPCSSPTARSSIPHDRPDIGDFTVPVEVHVDANGSISDVVISESTGNLEADALAVRLHAQRKFLPGLDEKVAPSTASSGSP